MSGYTFDSSKMGEVMQRPTPATYIEPEELAYNTYHGSHSRSNRHGMVMCSDGKIRRATLGVADTFFSIPAHLYFDGVYCAGYVTCDDDGTYWFHQSSILPPD